MTAKETLARLAELRHLMAGADKDIAAFRKKYPKTTEETR